MPARVVWVTTLAGDELGRSALRTPGRRGARVHADAAAQSLAAPARADPPRSAPQPRAGGNPLRRHEWEASEQDADGVTSRVRDLANGTCLRIVRTRWVLAADGAGSRVRRALGIEPVGPARLASFVMIHFEANLRPLVGHRPARPLLDDGARTRRAPSSRTTSTRPGSSCTRGIPKENRGGDGGSYPGAL